MRVAAILGRPPGLIYAEPASWVGSGGNGSTYERGCEEQTAQFEDRALTSGIEVSTMPRPITGTAEASTRSAF